MCILLFRVMKEEIEFKFMIVIQDMNVKRSRLVLPFLFLFKDEK